MPVLIESGHKSLKCDSSLSPGLEYSIPGCSKAERIFNIAGVLRLELKCDVNREMVHEQNQTYLNVNEADLRLLPVMFHIFQVELCTEGRNLAHTFHHKERGKNAELIAFSQYPRPADTPQVATLRNRSSALIVCLHLAIAKLMVKLQLN